MSYRCPILASRIYYELFGLQVHKLPHCCTSDRVPHPYPGEPIAFSNFLLSTVLATMYGAQAYLVQPCRSLQLIEGDK